MPHEAAARAAAPHGIVAESPAMKRVLATLTLAAKNQATVLIRGEAGTGTERLARALHAASPRQAGPFVATHCGAMPEPLLESLLFGQMPSSATGTGDHEPGLFERASGGTLLLDEIGDLAPTLQPKVQRVLEDHAVHPLGARAPMAVDVRVIATSHRDLEALVLEGKFRQDLLFRLNVIEIRIPPLRERPEDLLPLIAHFLDQYGTRLGRPQVTVTHEALERMRRHNWPGNVRELENVIERALVLGHGAAIGSSDLPDWTPPREREPAVEQVRSLSEVEREEIVRALRSVRGNKAAAARLLGLDRKTLYRKIELYKLRER
jgi:DNA-binding NtrC family response regulator